MMGMLHMVAAIGILVTIIVSLRILPERPQRYNKHKTFLMVIQWILSPVIAIVYQSAAAFYAQTRLLLGKYMEKFDVTKKVVKDT